MDLLMKPKLIPKSPTDQQYCPKCRKTLKQSTNFYQHKKGGFDELCRQCITMRIQAWDPDTFTWLFERFDVPYIPTEWNIIRDRAYSKDPIKFSAQAVFGKYLAKMRLKKWANYGWADSAKLQEDLSPQPEGEERIKMMKEALEKGEITQAQFDTYTETIGPELSYISPGSKEELEKVLGINVEQLKQSYEEKYGGTQPTGAPLTARNDSRFYYPEGREYEEVELEDVGANLTKEDKIYLATKWGRLYRADEWVVLEKTYNDFLKSFDVQGAGRIETLKMICKTTLKMNQAIDCGDIDAYQKLSRVYDNMMKSGKFTEAQNNTAEGVVDSVGEIVAYCEANGGKIPRFDISAPRDIVDRVITDMKKYTRNLIYEDKALATEIELYLKNRSLQEKKKEEPADEVEEYLEYNEFMENTEDEPGEYT